MFVLFLQCCFKPWVLGVLGKHIAHVCVGKLQVSSHEYPIACAVRPHFCVLSVAGWLYSVFFHCCERTPQLQQLTEEFI